MIKTPAPSFADAAEPLIFPVCSKQMEGSGAMSLASSMPCAWSSPSLCPNRYEHPSLVAALAGLGDGPYL